jgi:hypothetical protein
MPKSCASKKEDFVFEEIKNKALRRGESISLSSNESTTFLFKKWAKDALEGVTALPCPDYEQFVSDWHASC